MGKCDYCGENAALPYKCSYCGGTFCSEHRLPENHNCAELKTAVPPKIFIPEKRKTPSDFIKDTETSFVRKEDLKDSEPKKETTYRSKSPILIIFLILSLGINGILWFHYDSIIKENEAEIQDLNDNLLLLQNSLALKERDCLNLQSELDKKLDLLIQKEKEYVELQEESLIKIEEAYNRGEKHGYDYGYGIGNREGYSEGFRIGNETGYFSGYEIGIEIGVIGDYEGWACFVRDPSYQEVQSFLVRDTTDRLKYSENFTCRHFALTLKNNAYYTGYRCFYVWIEFRSGTSHAIVAFNTTDRGLIYVEPQSDRFVNLCIGLKYWNEALLSPSEYLVSYDDTIVDFDMMW